MSVDHNFMAQVRKCNQDMAIAGAMCAKEGRLMSISFWCFEVKGRDWMMSPLGCLLHARGWDLGNNACCNTLGTFKTTHKTMNAPQLQVSVTTCN